MSFLAKYKYDERLPDVEGPRGEQLPLDVRAAYLFARDKILSTSWHWLHYHFQTYPFHPMAIEMATRAALIERHIPTAGQRLLKSIALRCNREKSEQDYQGILQDMSEILVIAQIVCNAWPAGTAFFYEPTGSNGKRPEGQVSTPDASYLFEVKAPSLLEHQRKRQQNATQLPTRDAVPLEQIDQLTSAGGLTMPRDNPIKDFLLSANEKFAGFDRVAGANTLVIVWDDFIYEPISSLVSDVSGLLTGRSWLKDADGAAVTFDHIDAVIILRHLTYFSQALADLPLPDRQHGFDLGGRGGLPNILCRTPWGRDIPEGIAQAFRAVDVHSDALRRFADYRSQDRVMWL